MPSSREPAAAVQHINEAHRLATQYAETAIEHAMRCGRMLAEVKTKVPRGTFDGWIARNCNFGRSTAYNYIKAAKSSNALDGYTSLRQALSLEKTKNERPQTGEDKPEQATEIPPDETPPQRDERSQPEPVKSPAREPEAERAPETEVLGDGWVPEENEEAYLEQAEKEYADAIDKVMAADDKLAAAHDEIKRQAAEIASLKLSRDGFMNGRAAVVKMLKKEQRKVQFLSKELDKARAEIKRLGGAAA